MIIVPPSAKKHRAFGDSPVMLVGDRHIVFDEGFGRIWIGAKEGDQETLEFTSNVDLDRYLDKEQPKYPIRYHTVHLPYHAGELDDYLHEMGITIENRTDDPWNVEFSGSRFALMAMINDHWHSFQSEREEFEKAVASIQGETPLYPD